MIFLFWFCMRIVSAQSSLFESLLSVSSLSLCCLHLSWLPASSWKLLCFIDSLLLSMMLCHRKQCSLSLYSKGRALYRERMIQRFTFCFNFMPYICHNVTLSFLKKALDVMLTAQHSLVWSKARGKPQELKQREKSLHNISYVTLILPIKLHLLEDIFTEITGGLHNINFHIMHWCMYVKSVISAGF